MNKRRVLITGCGGMLGHAVHPGFAGTGATVLATDRDRSEPWLRALDVRDQPRLREAFESFRPDLVVHLAAETDLEFCERRADVAEATNHVATGSVAELTEAHGAALVYVSTAGVFSGEKDGYYRESDEPGPIMVYGRTKWLGERRVRERCSRHFILRAGWMLGGGRGLDRKFVGKIIQQVREGCPVIRAVHDRWGTPTYTHDFTANLLALIDRGPYGTYHMVCRGAATRFDVAAEVVRVCGVEDTRVVPVDSSHFADEYPAPRPRSEMLMNAGLQAIGLDQMRSWQAAVRDYIARDHADAIVTANTARPLPRGNTP